MGYGLPAAIGAKVARPDCLVIDIDGDSSFSMTLTELSTAAEFNIGCKILILNNDEQGMVTQWQTLFFEDRFSHTHQKNADFVKLGDAMGVQAKRVIKPDELEGALKWLIESDGPALLEVVVDQKVPVLPMVPTGSALHEFLVYDEGTSPNPPFPSKLKRLYTNFSHSDTKEAQSADQGEIGSLNPLSAPFFSPSHVHCLLLVNSWVSLGVFFFLVHMSFVVGTLSFRGGERGKSHLVECEEKYDISLRSLWGGV